jgi:hypothetical protein
VLLKRYVCQVYNNPMNRVCGDNAAKARSVKSGTPLRADFETILRRRAALAAKR